MSTYTVVAKDNGEIVIDGDVVLSRVRPGRSNNGWIRPVWTDEIRRDPETAFQNDPSLGACPSKFVGRAILKDVMVTPTIDSDQKLGDWPTTPEIDFEAGTATWTRQIAELTEGEIAIRDAESLSNRKDSMIASIESTKASLIDTGAPYGGYHIALDVSGRADLGGMATTATLALSETLSWPSNYAEGWITVENDRIELETPADGIALAASAGAHYASIVQRARTLKDAVLAAEDDDDLDAIDVESGWPNPDGE